MCAMPGARVNGWYQRAAITRGSFLVEAERAGLGIHLNSPHARSTGMRGGGRSQRPTGKCETEKAIVQAQMYCD